MFNDSQRGFNIDLTKSKGYITTIVKEALT